MKELIHFAHGNGFPSPCYTQLLNGLQAQFDCCYIDRIGHDPEFPVTDNWRYLVNEVILSIKQQAISPVIAVGHSLGGVLSLLAAIEEPALFKAVILLDSPLLGRFKSNIVRLSKLLGVIDRLTPAFRTRGRRSHWDTREEVWSYLKSRKLFRHFTDACLNDYIHYGLQHDATGYTLRFNPDIEYHIYRTIPHILHQYEGKTTVPCAVIYGNKSRVVDRLDLNYMKKQYGVVSYETKGTHMFPFEHPDAVATLLLQVIEEITQPHLAL